MSEQMKWAQRWSVNEDGEMVMDDHGSWVENAYYEYLKADYAVLKADAQLVVKHLGEACAENASLKAEVERLRASSFVTAVPVKQYERLVKAGDAMEIALQADFNGCPYEPLVIMKAIHRWRTAKETPPNA
jgi:hypothetical protein